MMKKIMQFGLAAGFTLSLLFGAAAQAADAGSTGKKTVDASDPTKIYSFIGVGPRHTAYTNGEHTWELRTTGTLALTPQDMAVFEIGYG